MGRITMTLREVDECLQAGADIVSIDCTDCPRGDGLTPGEFLRQVRESGDHCPCKEACRHHGNCFECVTIHRGHRDHLPMCLWDMVNERIAALSHITEGSLHAYEARVKAEREAAEAQGCTGGCDSCGGCE